MTSGEERGKTMIERAGVERNGLEQPTADLCLRT